MKYTAIAVFAAIAIPAAPAGAVIPLSLPRAAKVADKVRHREARNAFHLRERIGGPFRLGHTYCVQGSTWKRVLCKYEATQTATDAQGMRTSCTIDVRVRLHGSRRVTWRRSIEACAASVRPAPPKTP